jgi:hypothetical protein
MNFLNHNKVTYLQFKMYNIDDIDMVYKML